VALTFLYRASCRVLQLNRLFRRKDTVNHDPKQQRVTVENGSTAVV